jgi:hypothetical protein
MQQEVPKISRHSQEIDTIVSPQTSFQDGFQQLEHSKTDQDRLQQRLRTPSSSSVPCSSSDSRASADACESGGGVNAHQLDKRLRGLNVRDSVSTPGQRISDYENALTPSTPRQALGFKVVKCANPSTDGPQLADFPNGSSPSPCICRCYYPPIANSLQRF